MAYALRYYKEITQADGGMVRLEIHKKDSTSAAVEIGAVVQALSLEIQGQQDDIDTPIQKTSLHMTFVDASDIEDGQKNGFWEEFYTPDALMWKVILKAKDAEENAFRTIWGGYVTPDSFSEDLVYRGSVSITARDNIGHMQDFPFDAEGDADGMISLYNLVESGWEKIQSPMMLEWRGVADSTMWLQCDGVSAMFTLMNVAMFEGMDWYKAIETALASYGVVMRYVGNNIVKMSSLRSMPYQGEENIEDLIHIEPRFIAGAQRELVPAVKRIEESVGYELEESASQPQIKLSDFSGSTETYRCKIDGVDNGSGSFGTAEHDAPIWSINNTESWANTAGKSLFFNPHAYEIGYFSNRRGLGDEIKRFMYIAANNVDERSVSFSKTITCADLAIRIKFGLPVSLNSEGSSMTIEQQNVFNLKSIRYSVSLVQNGVTNYLASHGGWVVDKQEITKDFDASSQVSDFECIIGMGEFLGQADLTFTIHKIEYAQMSYANLADYGLYACIQDFALATPTSLSLREKNIVNTLYNADNNVILSRDPEIGPAFDKVALPAFIKNGIFYRNGNEILPARLWSWGGSEQQMAVWNHLQLLCYYAKPNNTISGTIVNADITRAKAIYLWHGARHILISGRYNFLTGHIESAILREFARYEDMWSEVAGSALPDTEQDSKSNVESGASSGGSSSTYTNTTTVNIGSGGGGGAGASYLNDLLDVNVESVLSQSVLYFNGTEWVSRSLATILNPYAKSDDLLSLSTLLSSMWTIDGNGNLVTDKNVIIKGDVASGGEGDVTTQGIVGIKVNGTTFYDTNADGIIDLGTISGGGGISQITSQMVIDALGYTPVRPTTLNNFLPKTGGQLTGPLQIFDHMIYDDNGEFSIDSMDTISIYAPNDIVIWSEEGQLYFNDKPVLTEHQSLANYVTNNSLSSALSNYQLANTAINTGNISAQSVAYAANAGAVGGIGIYNGTEGIATITSAGVMEVGEYIDFHQVGSTKDYSVRLRCSNNSGVSIHLPSAQGTLALSSQIPTMLSQLTDNVGYALASSLANYLPLTGGTISGALTVASTIQSNSIICGTTRLRVNATGSTTSFGFIDALLYGSTNNRSTVHIGSCYGGSSTLTNTAEYPSGVSMTAISMYRGRVGIGKRFSDSELSAAHDGNVALTVAGNQTINGNLVVTGDISA